MIIPPIGGFFFVSFISTSMSDYKVYANFNSVTVTGRVLNAELATNKGTEFLAVTLITNLTDDHEGVNVTFNTTNGLMSLFKKGWLNNGRLVTVTGHIASISELYFNEKTGKRAVRKRPQVHLTKAQVFDGGLGPAKKPETTGEVEIDEAPELATQEY